MHGIFAKDLASQEGVQGSNLLWHPFAWVASGLSDLAMWVEIL